MLSLMEPTTWLDVKLEPPEIAQPEISAQRDALLGSWATGAMGSHHLDQKRLQLRSDINDIQW